VAAAADAGFQVSVFMMPILPFLTDGEAHVDAALARIKAAGATRVTYSSLHLRPGVKEWFAQWLNTYRPDLTPRYRRLYGDGAYAPKEYRSHLASVMRPLIALHGLAQAETDKHLGSSQKRAEARDGNGEWRRARAGSHAREIASESVLF
jgi:DNA repair photolyase